MVYPKKGTVAFSTGIHGWAVTLNHFAKLYAFKFGIDEAKMMEMLWDDNFYDPKTKEWTTKNTGSGSCKRGFLQYVYEPKWLPAGNLLELMILHFPSPCTAQKYRVENLYEGDFSTRWENSSNSNDVPCGNTVALVGLDQFVTKNTILTNVEEVEGADE
ncbi:elongation factor 2 [Tanacetum coccineum]